MPYAEYKRSAVDILTPMLSINQRMDSNMDNMRRNTMEGVKGLVEGGVKAYTFHQRERKVQYIGDDALAALEKQLTDLNAELTAVENQMRTIKAEDINSLDKEWPEPTLHNAEQDVNSWDIDNGRLSSLNKDKYDWEEPESYQYNKLGKLNNLALMELDPSIGAVRPVYKSNEERKYKLGSKAFGGY